MGNCCSAKDEALEIRSFNNEDNINLVTIDHETANDIPCPAKLSEPRCTADQKFFDQSVYLVSKKESTNVLLNNKS